MLSVFTVVLDTIPAVAFVMFKFAMVSPVKNRVPCVESVLIFLIVIFLLSRFLNLILSDI